MNSPWARRLVPTLLGVAMLAVIVLAALTPNIGVSSAQVNAQYTSKSSSNTTLEYALIGVLVAAIVAALVGLLFFQRRKKRGGGGAAGGAGGVTAWQEPPSGGPAPPTGGTGGAGQMAPAGAVAGGGAGMAAAATTYDETSAPAETGPEWVEPAAPATVGAAGAPAAGESEPDIDRLMKELDQISDDILKKTPPKKGAPPETPSDDADT